MSFGGRGGRQLPPEMEAAAAAKQQEFEAMIKAEGGGKGGGKGGGGGGRSGPRTEVCYICGREFGSSSIGIHEKQCARKWEEAEAQKPAHERKPLPQRPEVRDGATREERNEAAKAVHEAEAMAHCACGRKFKDEETMRRHQKGCHAAGSFRGSSGRQLPPEMEAAAEAKMKEFSDNIKAQGGGKGGGKGGNAGGGGGGRSGPRTEVCYICGREFGSSSIGIHEKQCARKWEEAEAQKPAHERKPLPQRPEVRDGATREERNEAAKAVHEAEAMAHCACGRKFKDEETMRRHQKSCRAVGSFGGGSGRQLPPEMEAAAEAKMKEFSDNIKAQGGGKGGGKDGHAGGGGGRSGPRTVVCYICGREFGSSSIGIHEKQCARKFEEAEAQKPEHERKPLPQRPEVREGATREERNEAAKATHESEVMAHCPLCGRRFKDQETMQRHQRGCKGPAMPRGGSGAARSRSSELHVEDLVSKLFSIIDVDQSGVIDETEIEVALRAFGNAGEKMGFEVDYSFAAMDSDHSGGVDPAEFENALLPMEEILGHKKCCEVLNALICDVEDSLKAGSNMRIRGSGSGHFEGTAGVGSAPSGVQPCPNCGRNFNPESLAIHMRSCGGEHGTSRLARSQLGGGTRKQRDAAEAIHMLLQVSSRDPRLQPKLRAAFTKLDVDGNGSLDREEFQTVYQAADLPRPKPSLDELIAQYDGNHDERLQFAEFQRLMKWVLSTS